MTQTALERAKMWASNPAIEPQDREEIKKLIDNNDMNEIEERFYKDLEFGTGGLRSILGQGINRINKYTIRKATQALASELKASFPNTELKVAISYDSRRKSDEFAKQAAGVFAANGIHSFIYNRLNPVALLSFSIRHHNAQAGVMVTASHNPPEYNGYKVYWNDGAQVTPPNDKNIIGRYNDISDFSEISYMDIKDAEKEGLIHWVGEEVENAYFEAIKSKAINPEMCTKDGDQIKVVYTAIHGTGLLPCSRAIKDLGITNFIPVPEQSEPDGNFPTVKSPNPENAEALAMAVDLMKKENAHVAFGSDPDTDRLGVAVNHNGEVIYLNGNQIGTLMLHYILSNLKEQNRLPDSPYFVKTIVTTALQDKIAAHFGVTVENTLTGFKWICGRMREIEATEPKRNFVFATEESFGYLNHDFVRDKDGVSTIALMAEMTLWYQLKGQTLVDGLDDIYREYGFSHEKLLCLNYYGKEGSEKISRIMEKFRKFDEPHLCGEEIAIIEDYQTGEARSLKEGKTYKLNLPKSNVLGYQFANGNKVYLRPSGTEPKIKFYTMIQETEGSLDEKKSRAMKKVEKIEAFLKEESERA